MQFLCQNKELTRRGALLDFIVTNKGRLLRDVKVRGSPAPNDMVAQNLERMEQDPSSGLEERRLWLIQGYVWKNPMGYSPLKAVRSRKVG